MHGSSDQIRCSLIMRNEEFQITEYVMEHLDGEPLSPEEIIDIGQEEWKYKMPVSGRKTWKFLSNTPDMPKIKMQRTAFQAAFNSIQKLTKFDIDYEFDQRAKTDFTINWLNDIHFFDDKKSVLAHAYLYINNGSKNGVIEFNDSPEAKHFFTPLGWPVEAYLVDPVHFTKGQKDSNGNLIMRASQPATHIGMHEIGHSVGLRHDLLHIEAIMYPYVKQGYIAGKVNPHAFEWKNPDIERLQFWFGSSGIDPLHLDRWRARRIMRHIYER